MVTSFPKGDKIGYKNFPIEICELILSNNIPSTTFNDEEKFPFNFEKLLYK